MKPWDQNRATCIALPCEGVARVQMSPARRIPSHGTHAFATTYAIDFMPVDEKGRSCASFTWRTMFSSEAPELFVGFGKSMIAPANGVIERVHEGEPDHQAMRSQFALIPYGLSQRDRIAQGAGAIAGNYVVIRLDDGEGWLLLAHCKRGSISVREGDRVEAGQPIAQVGNSGNSTEPHIHLQLMDGPDGTVARGLPVMFAAYREQVRGSSSWKTVERGIPDEESLVEACRTTERFA